jgi:hypothetical protein
MDGHAWLEEARRPLAIFVCRDKNAIDEVNVLERGTVT